MDKKDELEQWRADKVEFVSNLNGGSAHEVILAMAVVPALALVLTRELLRVLKPRHAITRFLLEFAGYVAPIVLELTVLSGSITSLCISLVLCVILLRVAVSQKSSPPLRAQGGRRTVVSLTEFRGTLSYVTAVAILAVDFNVFPRRFAKTEIAGFSLMDAGVGLFSMSSGITTAMKSVHPKPQAAGNSGGNSKKQSSSGPWRTIAILFGLGAARLIAVKASGYPEHISEYGVHWNFFFTLGSVSLVVALLGARSAWASLILAVAMLGLRSYAGAAWGLDSWVLDRAPRRPLPADVWGFVPLCVRRFVEDNREGLLSVPGFVAIELVGRALGVWLFRPFQSVGDEKYYAVLSARHCVAAGLGSVGLWVASVAFSTAGVLPSRVLVNVPYVLFSGAVALASAAVFFGGWALFGGGGGSENDENKKKTRKGRKEKTAVNSIDECATLCTANGASTDMLATFLVANVATGLVNFSVNSITVPPGPSLAIILGYMFVVSLFAFVCDRYSLRIK